MKEVFVDSSYWLAVLHSRDALHEKAADLAPEGKWITTSAVILEVMDAFRKPNHRQLANGFWQTVCNEQQIVVVDLDRSLLARGADLFRNRPDKAWSLTDCISFVVMEERSIHEALSADHHFEQAGFRALLCE